MKEADARTAAAYARDGGLEVRGLRPSIGSNEVSLYVYDPTRNGMFYFSKYRDLQLHLAENTQRARERSGAHVKGRRRVGSQNGA